MYAYYFLESQEIRIASQGEEKLRRKYGRCGS